MRVASPLALALVLLAVPACTKDKQDPNAALNAARARLAAVAQATASATYDATYRFTQRDGNASGTIRIRQAPPQYRIDITTTDTASFFSLTTGTVSCSAKGTKKSCFLVARPGEEVPALFDPGVQRLFRAAVEDLAAHPADYVVTRVLPTETPSTTPSTTPSGSPSAPPSAPPLPAGECYLVNRVQSATPDQPSGFENGTYCFAEQGVATSIEVSSGTLTLTALGTAPEAAAFKPIAKVQQLPDLTPSPSKK